MKSAAVGDSCVFLVGRAKSTHGEGDLLELCMLSKCLVPAGMPKRAVLGVHEEWRVAVGSIGGVLDADVSAGFVGCCEKKTSASEYFVVVL